MKATLAWFNRTDPHDSRIAIVGGRPGFKQYIFYGDDLSNHVQYVAKHGPHGAYLPIASEAAQRSQTPGSPVQGQKFVGECRQWVTALNDGDYRYAVIGPDQRIQSLPPIEASLDRGGRRDPHRDDRRRLGLPAGPLPQCECLQSRRLSRHPGGSLP